MFYQSHSIIFTFLLIAHLTTQPGHVGLGHFQSCLQNIIGPEDFSNGDHSHHILLVQLDQQFSLCQLLQLLQVIQLTQGQKGCSVLFEQALLQVASVDELDKAPSNLLGELMLASLVSSMLALQSIASLCLFSTIASRTGEAAAKMILWQRTSTPSKTKQLCLISDCLGPPFTL